MSRNNQKMPALSLPGAEIVELEISDVKPYRRNPRVNQHAVGAIVKSIETYGYNQFIVIDKKNVIIAGDTRFKALKQLGWEKALFIRTDLDEKKAKEYRVVDNKSSELANWDDAALIQELREMELPNLEIYFKDVDLMKLVQESTGTIKWTEVTQEGFEKSAAKEMEKIQTLTAARAETTKTIMCPHCGEEFQITGS